VLIFDRLSVKSTKRGGARAGRRGKHRLWRPQAGRRI